MARNYQIINFLLAGIFGMVFLYSLVFSAERDNHPIPCYHKKITGDECRTCGFSNAFSEFMRGNFSKAREYNSIAGTVFFFFVMQFFLRLGLLVLIWRNPSSGKTILIPDVVFSVILFLWCFRKLLVFWQA